MNSLKGVKSCVRERVNIFLSHMWHLSRFTRNNCKNQSYVTFSEQAIQHIWHRCVKFVNLTSLQRSVWRHFQKVVWSFCKKYPCFNNFETRIDPIHISNKDEHNISTVKQKHHMSPIMQGILEYYYFSMQNLILGNQSHHACHRVTWKVYHPHQTPDEGQVN